MTEKKYRYTAKIQQPQKVAGVKLSLSGGIFTEQELKVITKDAYGASLLDKKLLIIEEIPVQSVGKGKQTGRDFEMENEKASK